MQRLKRLFTPGLAIAVGAAILGMAGTAVASHLLTGDDIRNGSLTGADIKSGSIEGRDIKNGTIRGKDINPDTLRALLGTSTPLSPADPRPGPQGSQGERGAQGARGPQGDAGPRGEPGLDSDAYRTITGNALGGFRLQNVGDGNASFVDTDGSPSLNPGGALKLDIGAAGPHFARLGLPTPAPNINYVADLTTLTYEHKTLGAKAGQVVAATAKITVTGAKRDDGAASGFTTLVYEPANNGYTGGTDWRTERTMQGKWWSTRAIAGGACGQACPLTLAQIVAANPDMKITPTGDSPTGITIEAGENAADGGWAGFSGVVDNLRLGYDGGVVRYDLGG